MQVVIDENIINQRLNARYNDEATKEYNVSKEMLEWIPKHYKNTRFLIRNRFMSNYIWKYVPGLIEDIGHSRLLDIKCGFSQDKLRELLKETDVAPSELHFHEDNRISFTLSAYCTLYNYGGTYKSFDYPIVNSERW